ncbi:YbhN family protein [Tardiphaga sp.]|uniref:lysylphosphatidylglycerol synthase transmembrane domain-containing protein n=1 Tax=Tardiphaga sp. TaxID=1926292 RepID=UPI0026290B8C|nr:YbhN family protein [Tardiphaga sp.]
MRFPAIPAIWARRGWKSLGVVLSVTIAVYAFMALTHALKGVDFNEVLAAMRLTHPASIALSLALVALSYGSLTLYDQLALRLIGRGDIPYRIAALASFTSYPIAHGTGAVLLVSSSIRYRIYAPHRIGVADVARICFLTGLTFWLGNLTALGLSILYEPEAISRIDHLSPHLNGWIAIAVLAGIVTYVGWTWNGSRLFGRRRWAMPLPSGRNVFLQIGIGLVDLGAAALAMYVLMPAAMDVGVARVIVVFIAATLLGFASHAPAGIGVFDATILVGLGGEHNEQLLAVLLLFRLFYHLTPFVLALALFGAVELHRNIGRRKLSQAG